jgi:hypothetical protein
MHARVEHLLSLRDGAPVDAAVRAHVEHCAECGAALAEGVRVRARLRALPAVEPAGTQGWDGVRARLAARGLRERRRGRLTQAAVAASIAVIAVAAAWRLREAPDPAPRATIAAVAPLTAEQAIAADRVAQLQTQSAALEDVLARLGERPAVARAGMAVPIDALEAQVQWIDHQITLGGDDARESEQLWRERVQAMDSLVRLRYVEAQRIAM